MYRTLFEIIWSNRMSDTMWCQKPTQSRATLTKASGYNQAPWVALFASQVWWRFVSNDYWNNKDKWNMNIWLYDEKWRPLTKWVSDSLLMLCSLVRFFLFWSRVHLCSTVAQLQATEIQSGNVGILAFLAAKGQGTKMTRPAHSKDHFKSLYFGPIEFCIHWLGNCKISVLYLNCLQCVHTQVREISATKIRRTPLKTSLVGLSVCMLYCNRKTKDTNEKNQTISKEKLRKTRKPKRNEENPKKSQSTKN